VVLVAVPGAHDVELGLGELLAQELTTLAQHGLDLADDRPLTHRTTGVRAVVLVREELALVLEDEDLTAVDLHALADVVREVLHTTHVDLGHSFAPHPHRTVDHCECGARPPRGPSGRARAGGWTGCQPS